MALLWIDGFDHYDHDRATSDGEGLGGRGYVEI